MKKKLLFTVLFLTTIFSFAQNLDPVFGPNGGIVTLPTFSYSPSNDYVRAAAIQADGKILVVGSTLFNNYGDFYPVGYIARFTSNQILDSSFNFCGFRYLSNVYSAVALQADGKIIIASSVGIFRLNSDGSTDTSFVSPNLTTYDSLTIQAITINTSGKIMFVGTYSNGIDNDIILGSINSDGSLNTAFSNDGITTLNLPGSDEAGLNLKIDPLSGKILVCGYKVLPSSESDFLVTRFTNAGALDVFGTNGVLTFDYGTNDVLTAMDFQSNGKLVAVGTTVDAAGGQYLIARRINGNGTLDSSLNYNQFGFRIFEEYDIYNRIKPDVKIIASDKIVIAGTSYLNSPSNNGIPAIVQLDSTGAYDTTNFVGTYPGYSDANNFADNYTSFLLQKADGDFIVGGTSSDAYSNSIRMVNFSATGPFLSETYKNLTSGKDNVISIVEQNNGKTIALVSSEQQFLNGGVGLGILVRYNSNGNIDTLFGADNTGIVDTGLSIPYRLTKQADGKIIVVNTEGMIKRYTADGFLDTGFANSGELDFSYGATNGKVSFIDNIVTSADGKIYIVFDYRLNSVFNVGLYRLNNDGSIDTTFGVDGIATTRFDYFATNEAEWPTDAFIQADNKIVVATSMNYNGNWVGGVVKFNATGTVDTTFGNNGKVTTQEGTVYYPYTIKSTQNNKFLVDARVSSTRLLTQFNSDGSYDTSFGTAGSVTVPYSDGDMVLQPDGKILCSNNGSINRYTTAGVLDTTFGNNGVLTTTVYTNFGHKIQKLLWTQSGKLLEAGNAFTGSKNIGTLIRYTDLTLGVLDFEVAENKIMVYPNPIASDATFSYTLQEDSAISITIVDIMGRVVKTIRANEMQNAGDHQQNVAIGELASGNYLLVFTSPKGTQTVKLIKRN
ncbi:MAG: hypothetical protein RL427_562 [Bacteroidota bacterium]|jgi:uncharacterized delta-60 repeat protein